MAQAPLLPGAKQRLLSWGSQVKLAKELKKWLALSRSSIASLCDLLDQDVLSLESSEQEVAYGRLDEHFLLGHALPYPMSLPFLTDKSWNKLYSAWINPFHHSNCTNVEGLAERGYVKMPPVGTSPRVSYAP